MARPARAVRSEAEDLTALALEGMPAAVMILDRSGRVLYASPRTAEILGGKVESITGDAKTSEGFPRKEAFALLCEACEKGSPVSRLVSADLQVHRYFQISAGPAPGAEGLTAVLILDLTALVSQGDMTREFVRQVRHDLRGPLTSMRGAVDLLLTERLGPLEEKQKKILGLVEKATRQMTSIVSGTSGSAAEGKNEKLGQQEKGSDQP